MTLREFIAFSRLHFLGLTVMVYCIGLAFARRDAVQFDLLSAALGLIIMLLVQLTTGYINEHFDQPTDQINVQRTAFTGGSGVTLKGRFALYAALTTASLSLVLVVILALFNRLPPSAVPVYLCALAISFAYTAPPFRLVWRGLGEITTGMTIALLIPFWAYTLQGGLLNLHLALMCLPFALVITAMMLVIATPDRPADVTVGKRTLVVRLGHDTTAHLYGVLLAVSYIGIMTAVGAGFPWVGAAAIWLTIPLAMSVWQQMRRYYDIPAKIPRMVLSAAALSGTIGFIAFLALLFA